MSSVERETVVAAAEGDVVTALGSRYVHTLLGRHTRGAFSLVEETLLGPDGPPVHVHDDEEETFYVLAARYGTRIVGPPVGSPYTLKRNSTTSPSAMT